MSSFKRQVSSHVLFEKKFDNRYLALHRPCGKVFSNPAIWLASSANGTDWGDHRRLFSPRPARWDCARIGCGPRPVLTRGGWLEIYHGADFSDRYCGGAALLDRDRPDHVLWRSEDPFLFPERNYERTGFMPDVVFPTGLVEMDSGQSYLYYGAADDKIRGARFDIERYLVSI